MAYYEFQDGDTHRVYDEHSTAPLSTLMFADSGKICWNQIGNVYALVDMTNASAWVGLVKHLFTDRKVTRVVVLSGRHGDLSGGFDDSGAMIPTHDAPEFFEEDGKTVTTLRGTYPVKDGYAIELQNVSGKSVAQLKAFVQAKAEPGTAVVLACCFGVLVFRQYDADAELARINGLVSKARQKLVDDAQGKKLYDSFLDKKSKEEANKIYGPELIARQAAIKRDTVAEAVAKYWAWFRRPRGHEVAVRKALLEQRGMALN